MFRPGLLLLVFGLVWIGFGGLSVQAQTDENAGDVHPVVGSWLVEVEVDGESTLLLSNLVSFTSDGIVLVAAPTLLPELPEPDASLDLFSSGHGAWIATGGDTAEIRFVFLVVDAQGRPSSINVIDGELDVDAGGDAYTGEYTLTIVSATGESGAPSTGTWNATRIAVGSDLMAEPEAEDTGATPVSAEPASTPAT